MGSAEAGLRRNVDILRSGILGNVTAVYVWTDRPIWPQGQPRPQGKDAQGRPSGGFRQCSHRPTQGRWQNLAQVSCR